MTTKYVPKNKRHIVACGGGFTSPALLEFILGLSGKENPKVLIINTATGDSQASLLMTYRKLAGMACRPNHLTFFERTPPNLEEFVLGHDVIWVGGGNTKSMLAVWREYGLDKILLEAWKRGVILSGSSAGGICWFDDCVTDSWDVEYTALPALGFLKGSCCPHYDGEAGRQETYHRLIEEGKLAEGLAIDEGVGVHFLGDKQVEVVSAKPASRAYHVRRKGAKLADHAIEPRIIS